MANDDGPAVTQLEQWVRIATTIVAPVTVLGAVLFYFGYVSSSAEFAYFGINVDTIGLSTQGYIMRSPQTLLAPLLVLTLASAGFLMLNSALRGRIAAEAARSAVAANAAKSDLNPAHHAEHIRHMIQWSRVVGLAALSVGVILVFTYSYVRNWAPYGLVTPLLIGLGSAIIGYTSRLLNLLQRLLEQHAPTGNARDARPARASPARADSSALERRIAGMLIYVVIAACIFWATATVAQWSGLGLAHYDAKHLDNLPSVILDTKERLFLLDPGIQEYQLPRSDGQTFHYRYWGLRLLIEGQDRMFLVPDQWSANDSTLVVPLDGSVRVQFQFQNQRP
jgi:hypothetical protein